ncbi:hypothetical protein ILUMI_00750 [Ignelater luminosus]|uniref:Peptidase S1 domain-containing protein n=1 Tax=Ignelater luminosus TaxID=2038154 RepID=A0A8K0DGM4_IGNLU|nr:hypothetical protein ILUMI_00750 [Ignelater luminosus]
MIMKLNQMILFLIHVLVMEYQFVNTVVPVKPIEVTGKIRYLCAIYRLKDWSIDDNIKTPPILTFCTCVKLSPYYVITARDCSVQKEWLISVVETTFTTKLLPVSNRKKISRIVNYKYLTLLQLNSELITGSSIQYSKQPLRANTVCYLYSFITASKLPFEHNTSISRTGIWAMQGGVYEIEVRALYWKNCKPFFKHHLFKQGRQLLKTTLCILPVEGNEFEPCAFDMGVPVVCNKKLQGILVDPRPLSQGVPNDFESECYRNVTIPLPYFAESFDQEYSAWIARTLPVHSNTVALLFTRRLVIIVLLVKVII